MITIDMILYIFIFCIGTLFGSFFTLAVYRIPLGKDIIHERSFCPNCNHKLSFLDMIPVLSYVCLGGKCRYCQQKIRPRYLLLEILSGVVFVLFAVSIQLSIVEISLSKIVYFCFGLLYLATLFIIAGIDKEKIHIEKKVLLFGYVVEAIYIVYLYIVEQDSNIYRYVIYLVLICALEILDIAFLRKKVKNSYPIEVLLLCMLILTFSYEGTTIFTIDMTLIAVAMTFIISKISQKKKRNVQKVKKQNIKIPIGFYLCVSNIICLLAINYYMFYLR